MECIKNAGCDSCGLQCGDSGPEMRLEREAEPNRKSPVRQLHGVHYTLNMYEITSAYVNFSGDRFDSFSQIPRGANWPKARRCRSQFPLPWPVAQSMDQVKHQLGCAATWIGARCKAHPCQTPSNVQWHSQPWAGIAGPWFSQHLHLHPLRAEEWSSWAADRPEGGELADENIL